MAKWNWRGNFPQHKLSRNGNHLTPETLAEIKRRNLKIWVGMPCNYEVTMDWVDKMRVPLSRGSPWWDIATITYRGYSVESQRSTIVENFLGDTSATHLLWLDTDNIPESPLDPNEALAKLILRDVPIVSGIYAMKGPGFPPSFYMGEISRPRSKDFFEVKYTGLGFCLIKREVFERITPPWFACKKDSKGEDVFFCIKAREAGYKVMVDSTVKLGHIGFLMVKADGSASLLPSGQPTSNLPKGKLK